MSRTSLKSEYSEEIEHVENVHSVESVVTRVTSYNSIAEKRPIKDDYPKNAFCINVKQYAQELSDLISFDGIRYLFEEGVSFFERILWLSILAASIIACIFLIIYIHHIHSKNPIIIRFKTQEYLNSEIPFPAVTICPQPMQTKNLEYRSLICESYLPYKKGHFPEFLGQDFEITMAPNIEDILESCYFENEELDCSDVFKPTYTKFGLCYSFNTLSPNEMFRHYLGNDSMKNSSNLYRSARSGIRNSLRLLLKQKESQLDSYCGFGISGFKIAFHNASQVPNFHMHYLTVSLHSLTSIALSPTMFNVSNVIKSYTPKVRKCYFAHEKYLKFYKFYSSENCCSECLTNYTMNACGCVAFYMPRDDKMPICGVPKLNCLTDAINKYEHNIDSEIQQCDCEELCNEIVYDLNLSKVPKNFSLQMNTSEYGFGQLNIFFASHWLRCLERIEFYGITDIMANIGGLLNFFSGCSIITLFEIIYSLSLKIICNKIIYGPWAGPASIEYNFVVE